MDGAQVRETLDLLATDLDWILTTAEGTPRQPDRAIYERARLALTRLTPLLRALDDE